MQMYQVGIFFKRTSMERGGFVLIEKLKTPRQGGQKAKPSKKKEKKHSYG